MSWSYNFIDIRRFINMFPLPIYCSNDIQYCESKIAEETQKKQTETQWKITRIKVSIWRHDIAFLNFLINTTLLVLAIFQFNYFVNPLDSEWRPTDVSLAPISRSNFSHTNSYIQLILEAGRKLVFTKFKVNWVLLLRRKALQDQKCSK